MWQACVWMASPFRWPLLNGAACWHSKRQRTTNTNQSSPLACFDPLPKNAITGPYPGVPSTLLWIKDTGKRGKDKNLALYPIFCPLCDRPLLKLKKNKKSKSALLHLHVWLNANDRRAPASFVCLLESASLHVCGLKLKLGFCVDRAGYMFAKHLMPPGSTPIPSLPSEQSCIKMSSNQYRESKSECSWCGCSSIVLCPHI